MHHRRLLLTTAIGFVHSIIITKLGIPSFVMTLAAFLIWSGVLLYLTTELTTAGTIRIQDQTLIGLANNFMPVWLGWLSGIVVIAGYTAFQVINRQSRLNRNLEAVPFPIMVAQIVAVGGAGPRRGLRRQSGSRRAPGDVDPRRLPRPLDLHRLENPLRPPHLCGRRQPGGSEDEPVSVSIRIRIAVFMINGFMAGVGGIILVSRLRSVATNTGGGNLLLNVIAAAVIGGTSLFGGQGRVVSAFYGALVITAIQNGMDLLGLSSGFKFIITGIVLLLAVLVDSVSKRRRTARGLA